MITSDNDPKTPDTFTNDNPMTKSSIIPSTQTSEDSPRPSRFERMSTQRSSMSNSQNTHLNNSHANPLRASFNNHKPLKPVKLTPDQRNENSSIEYASFNIKPSQYKQTGIFLPINNSTTSAKVSTNTQGPGPIYAKNQSNSVRYLKEDLELLIQQLRNVQKQELKSNNHLGQFCKSIDQFIDKAFSQLLGSNSSVESDAELQLRQLQSVIKSQSQALNEHSDLTELSKAFNEYMQVLDRLNAATSVFNQCLGLVK